MGSERWDPICEKELSLQIACRIGGCVLRVALLVGVGGPPHKPGVGMEDVRQANVHQTASNRNRMHQATRMKPQTSKQRERLLLLAFCLLLLADVYSVYSQYSMYFTCNSIVLQCTLHRRVLYVLLMYSIVLYVLRCGRMYSNVLRCTLMCFWSTCTLHVLRVYSTGTLTRVMGAQNTH